MKEVVAVPEPTPTPSPTLPPEPTPTREVKTPRSWEIQPRYEEEYTNGKIIIKLVTDESFPEGIKIGIKPGRESLIP